jgi:hypothetical protein
LIDRTAFDEDKKKEFSRWSKMRMKNLADGQIDFSKARSKHYYEIDELIIKP